ncbi:MAG: response regulator [Polyangiales bacterium]
MKKILVVDDSAAVRQQVGMTLQQAGYAVAEAGDGVEGLQQLNKGGVAMVICDVNMPRMGGLEMIESMKSEQRYVTTPVVMLTTEGHPDLLERAKRAGAKGWIVKPFKADLLLAAVAKLAGK